MNRTALIIDDDETFLKLTSRYLTKNEMGVKTASTWDNARSQLVSQGFDIILLDLFLPDASGMDVLKEVKQIHPETPVMMITAHSSLSTAIEAVKSGAEDYIQKPCENNEILFKIQKVFEKMEKDQELIELKESLSGQYRFESLVTRDQDMKNLFDLAKSVSENDVTVYISGETGTGKEVLARAIHQNRKEETPFVVVNCAALNENLIESELFGHKKGAFTSAYMEKEGKCASVGNGTLFIDEVGELSLGVQKKLLRILQEGEFEPLGSNVTKKFKGRIVLASHRNLKQMVNAGDFREDLFFRIMVFPLHLKPLRNRKVDLIDLSNRFIEIYCRKYDKDLMALSPSSIKLMMDHSWPGNIRELEHFLERQILVNKEGLINLNGAEVFTSVDHSDASNISNEMSGFQDYMKSQEKDYLIQLLSQVKGVMEDASKLAGMHRKTLYLKLKEYGLDKKDFK